MNAIPLITVRPILRPQYVTTPETAENYTLWLRANIELVWAYYVQLDEQQAFTEVAPDEFAAMQWDCERARMTEVRS